MRLVAYCRASVASDDSIDAQEERIRAWADREGHDVATVVVDNGVSGAEDDRPNLPEALSLVQDADVEGLVIHRLDRLARALHLQEAILGTVWRAGGHVFTTDTGEVPKNDPDDPGRVVFRKMLGFLAEIERDMTVARMQGGRRRKASRGGFIGGTATYGFRVEGEGRDAVLVPIEHEQRVVTRIQRLRRRGKTLREIAETLNRGGVVTRGGGPWATSTIDRLARRDVG